MKYEGVSFHVDISKFPTVEDFKTRFKHLWPKDTAREKKLEEAYQLLKLLQDANGPEHAGISTKN